MSVIGRHLALEGNIRVLAVQTLISQIGFGMFYVVWQPYILSTGLNVVALGFVQSVINLSSASGSIIWGILSDRFGRKPIILFSNASRVMALVALILSGDSIFLFAFGFFVGFSALFMQGNPARSALISESVRGERRATAFSAIMSISQITVTLTASAGGYLAVKAGYNLIFYIAIVCDIVGILLMALFIQETLGRRRSRGETARSLVKRMMDYLRPEAGVGRLYMIMLVMGVGFGTGYSLLFGLLVDSYGFTPFQLGLLSTAFNLAWGLSSIPLGRLSDRFGRRPLLMASWSLAVITCLGLIASRSLEMFLIFEVTSALDHALWIPAWMALIAENVPSERLSTVIGMTDSYAMLAGIPAPWFGGLLYSSFGFAAPLTIYLICLMIAGILIFSLKEKQTQGR